MVVAGDDQNKQTRKETSRGCVAPVLAWVPEAFQGRFPVLLKS